MELHEALKAALPHVAMPKHNLPTLEHLLLTPEGVLYATDRYTLVRIEVTDSPLPAETMLIPATVAKQVKTKRIVAITPSSVTLQDGAVLGWQPYPNTNFPDVEGLITKERSVKPLEMFRWDWEFPLRFANKHLPRELHHTLTCTPMEGNIYRFDSPTGEFTGLLCGRGL